MCSEVPMQTISAPALAELRAIDPKRTLSPELYGAIAGIIPSVAIEAVVLRQNKGDLEVYLTRRSPNDAAYPNMLHCPGSLLRSGETPEDTLRRLAKTDFGVTVHSFQYVGEIYFQEVRGWFNCRAHLVLLDGEPTQGEWHSVYSLPDDVVQHHIDHVIPMVAQEFRIRQLV